MFRAVLEFLIVVLMALVARAFINGVLRGFSKPRRSAGNAPSPSPSAGGELHKDPVCGTYVAESTPFRSQIAGQRFYYCSENCREKHALVAR